MNPPIEDVKVFLGPGVISKPKALAEHLEKLILNANSLGREGKTVTAVQVKAEFGVGTWAILKIENTGSFLKK